MGIHAENNNIEPQCPSPRIRYKNWRSQIQENWIQQTKSPSITILQRPKTTNPSTITTIKTPQPKPLAQKEKEYALARSKIFNQETKVYKHPNHPHRTPRAPSP